MAACRAVARASATSAARTLSQSLGPAPDGSGLDRAPAQSAELGTVLEMQIPAARTTISTTLRCAIAAALLASWPLAAHAQPVDAQESARVTSAARALFREGVACADRGAWRCAVDRFGRARAIRPSAAIVSNHAVALAHVGRLVEASESYQAVIRDEHAPADLRAAAERGIAALRGRIAQLTLHTTGSTDGVTFALDGEVLSSVLVGERAPVDPGRHVVQARRAGRVVASARVHLAPGASERVELRIPRASPRERASSSRVAPATERVSASEAPRVEPAVVARDVLEEPRRVTHHEIYDEWWFWAAAGAVTATAVGIGVGVAAAQSTPADGTLGTVGAGH